MFTIGKHPPYFFMILDILLFIWCQRILYFLMLLNPFLPQSFDWSCDILRQQFGTEGVDLVSNTMARKSPESIYFVSSVLSMKLKFAIPLDDMMPQTISHAGNFMCEKKRAPFTNNSTSLISSEPLKMDVTALLYCVLFLRSPMLITFCSS